MKAPVYVHPPAKVSSVGWRRVLSLTFLEDLFFLATTILCFYLAVMVVISRGSILGHVAGMMVFWAVVAYLAMPRVNQMLTAIYVPDYFMGRTRTSDGVLGDPVNLALLGSAGQIHRAMRRAGWTQADPVTLRSSWGIVVSSVLRQSYPAAPVSPLFLFGRMQDFAYQQEVDGNAAQRHHVRFFRCPTDWVLPGGRRVDWLASGSYDRSVGVSLFTLQVTHRIDANLDVERDYIIASVQHTVPEATVDVIQDFSTGYHSRNGGGDRVETDGDLPILDLRAVEPMLPSDPHHTRRRDVGARPASVVAAVVLSLVSTVIATGHAVHELLTDDPQVLTGTSDGSMVSAARSTGLGVIVILAVALLLLAYQTYRGRAWARVAMLAMSAASLAGHVGIGPIGLVTMLELSLDLGIMYALTATGSRTWTGCRR